MYIFTQMSHVPGDSRLSSVHLLLLPGEVLIIAGCRSCAVQKGTAPIIQKKKNGLL